MSKKRKSKTKYVIITVILSLMLLFSLSLFFKPVRETALPDDLQLTREEFFPKIDSFIDQEEPKFSDTIVLDKSIDTSSIYKLEFKLTACSTKAEIILDGKKIGDMSFGDCENLYYDDNDDYNYIHYQTNTFEKYYRDGEFPRTFTYEVKLTPTDGRTFVDNGQTITAEDPFSLQGNYWRRVQCTRSSQCIPVTITLEGIEQKINPKCSLKNECSIELVQSVEDAGIKVLPEEDKPISQGMSQWILWTIIGVILVGLGFTFYKIFGKKRKKK